MDFSTILEAVGRERRFQGWKHPGDEGHDFAAWILLAEQELSEAKAAWISEGDTAALRELLQVAAICVAAMENVGEWLAPDAINYLQKTAVDFGAATPVDTFTLTHWLLELEHCLFGMKSSFLHDEFNEGTDFAVPAIWCLYAIQQHGLYERERIGEDYYYLRYSEGGSGPISPRFDRIEGLKYWCQSTLLNLDEWDRFAVWRSFAGWERIYTPLRYWKEQL